MIREEREASQALDERCSTGAGLIFHAKGVCFVELERENLLGIAHPLGNLGVVRLSVVIYSKPNAAV